MRKHQEDYERFCQSRDLQLSGVSYPCQQNTVLQHVFARDHYAAWHMGLYLADKNHSVTLNACTHPQSKYVWAMSCTIEAPNVKPLVLGGPAMLHADVVDTLVFLESECAVVHQALGLDYPCQDPVLLRQMHRHVHDRRMVGDKPYIVSGGMVVLDETVADMEGHLNEIPKDHDAFQRYMLMGQADEDAHKTARFLSPMSNVPCVKQAVGIRQPGSRNAYNVSFVSSDGTYTWPKPLEFTAAVRVQMGIGGLFVNNGIDMVTQSAMPLHCRNWQHVPAEPDYRTVRGQTTNRSLN